MDPQPPIPTDLSQQRFETTRRCEAILEECNMLRAQLSTSQQTINQHRRFQASLKSRMLAIKATIKAKMNEAERRISALENKVENSERRLRAVETQLARAPPLTDEPSSTGAILSCGCTHVTIIDNHRKIKTRIQQVLLPIRMTQENWTNLFSLTRSRTS